MKISTFDTIQNIWKKFKNRIFQHTPVDTILSKQEYSICGTSHQTVGTHFEFRALQRLGQWIGPHLFRRTIIDVYKSFLLLIGKEKISNVDST